ncbi:MAG: hypothetical protein ABWY06_05050 [Pseudomonas sp.]|uniref:hypothetical protein n=1 Tax=Pseudomonas sp. TaxID=306 RepID=UPI00339B5424
MGQWGQRLMAGLVAMGLHAGAAAGIEVPAGGSWQHPGQLDLAGGSLVVDGLFRLDNGQLSGLDDLDIGAVGQLWVGSGTIALAGDWRNLGQFDAGAGQVSFVDGAASASILGDNAFHDLSLISLTGKTWRLASGRSQTISGLLTLHGRGAQPLLLTSSQPGQAAYVNLLPGGSQAIQDLGVTAVHATGQPLARGQSNRGGSDALGWFGLLVDTLRPIPSLSNLALVLLAGGLMLASAAARRRGAVHP